MDILRISVLGVGGVLIGLLLKERAPEYVSLITMGIGLVILGLAVGKIGYLFESLERLRWKLYHHIIKNDRDHLHRTVFVGNM